MENDWILDCFSDSGTTGKACEIDTDYYNMTIERICIDKFKKYMR